MSLEITPDGTDPLAKLAALTAVEACGHLADPRNAPPPVVGYAKGFSRAVVSIAKTVKSLRTSDPAVVHNALSRLAREGLMPGDVGDVTSTGYLFQGKNGLTAEPNPRGRIACAHAAGFDVRTVAIHKNDKIALNGDGDIDTERTDLDPDNRPTKWEHVKGVMIHVDDLHTGARRSLWVSAAEIATRKEQAGGQGAWNKDAVSMACTKAIKIAIARGAIPQASLIPSILAACASHPSAPRALTIEAAAAPRQIAEPTPAAPPPAEPEPTPEPEAQPEAPAEPEQPEAPAPRPIGVADIRDRIEAAVGGPETKFSWDDIGEAMASTLRRAATATAKKGGTWNDDDISPAAADWIVPEAVKTLRSM